MEEVEVIEVGGLVVAGTARTELAARAKRARRVDVNFILMVG